MRLPVAWLLMLVLGSLTLAAAPPKEHPAKADLIADVSAVQPGQAFQVALRVEMKPDWHIYWIEPGDSGTATEIKWNVPAGWTVEPLPFPTPHKFTMPGEIVNNGYSGTVLFLARVTPPADAKGPAELSADAEWLVCNPDMCIPGKGSPKLSLEVASPTQPRPTANVELFKTWQSQLPDTSKTSPFTVAGGAGGGQRHVAQINWERPVKNVEVFVAPGKGWLAKDVKAGGTDASTSIEYSVKHVGKKPEVVEMVVLIAYDDAGGVRRSVQYTYPLNP